ncbi:hypothetical protein DH86_00000661, partial [Scytalidium sp. 3C]
YRSPFIPETARESVRVEIQKGKSETSREQGKTKKESEAMPHSYISEYPLSTDVDPGIKTFLEDLYRTSDDPSRLHTPIKVFPFGADSTELMLYGTVAYGYKDGRKAEIEWAGRVNMTKENGEWKMSFYQVY